MTDAQLDLLGGETPVDELGWGPVMRLLADRERGLVGPLMADEAGAIIHEQRGKHPADQRCRWCTEDGTDALNRLRQRQRQAPR